jgi:hypothetical protein
LSTSGGILETIVNAKGDLLTATAADVVARLPVGTDGQVLESRSTESTGLKWVAAGGSSIIAVASATSDVLVNNPAGDTDLVTVSFTTTGKPVLVIGITTIRLEHATGANAQAITRLKRDTTVIDTRPFTLENISGDATVAHEITQFLFDYRATTAGTYTYRITGNKVVGTATYLIADLAGNTDRKIFVAELNF